MLLFLLLPAAVGDACSSSSSLQKTWHYLPPHAFDHTVTDQGTPAGWFNQPCEYTWTANSTTSSSNAAADTNSNAGFNFASPAACVQDRWAVATVARKGVGNEVAITYHEGNGTGGHGYGRTSTERGWAGGDHCSYIDMDNGGLYIAGGTPTNLPHHEWIRAANTWLVRAAQIKFPDGTKHLTPGYPTHYDGQWLRDGYYGIANAWALVNQTAQRDFAASAEWMFSRARKDGTMPQACPPSGPCNYGQYCNDTVGVAGWEGCQDLDSAAFAVKLAHHVWRRYYVQGAGSASANAFYRKWSPTLLKSMKATTKSPDGSGLLWSNASRPMVGYGFQDAEIKSGDVLYSSILQWNASLLLAEMAAAAGDGELAEMLNASAAKIRRAATEKLWDHDSGMFVASTGVEKSKIDVWGNALAGATEFATSAQAASIFAFFKSREADIFYEGQVREIPKPDQWDEVRWISGEFDEWPRASPAHLALAPVYQNGGYWATPHHHMLPFLAKYDRIMACRLLNDTVASFRGHGIWEWVGPFYPAKSYGAPGYTASAANTLFASEHLRCWEPAEDC